MAFPSFDFEKYQQTELFNLLEENPFVFGVMAIIVAPIIEEGAFRSLIKPTENQIIYFCCAWFILISSIFIPPDAHWVLKYVLLALSVILIFMFLKAAIPQKTLSAIKTWLHLHYKAVWIVSAFLFGLVHVFNYVEGFEINILLFLLIFPRIIAGYFFGKVKMENKGMVWPIVMHAMNNSIILFFLIPKLFSLFI